jgi:hypothetical protein
MARRAVARIKGGREEFESERGITRVTRALDNAEGEGYLCGSP